MVRVKIKGAIVSSFNPSSTIKLMFNSFFIDGLVPENFRRISSNFSHKGSGSLLYNLDLYFRDPISSV